MKHQATKIAIEKSFLKLLSEKYFEKITVKDIVDECGVTRNTFYYYFEDVYDIIDEIIKRELKQAINEGQEKGIDLPKLLYAIVGFFVSDKTMASHLFKSSKKDEICIYIDRSVKLAVEYYANLAIRGRPITDGDLSIIVDFHRFAIMGLFNKWIANGMRYELKDEIIRGGSLMADSVNRAVERGCL